MDLFIHRWGPEAAWDQYEPRKWWHDAYIVYCGLFCMYFLLNTPSIRNPPPPISPKTSVYRLERTTQKIMSSIASCISFRITTNPCEAIQCPYFTLLKPWARRLGAQEITGQISSWRCLGGHGIWSVWSGELKHNQPKPVFFFPTHLMKTSPDCY